MVSSKENKVTITDIAERANVSMSTVSRVLNGTAVVSKSKYNAVMKAIEELDYRPNIFAQSLASGQSMTIGVLTHNFGSPFYDGILHGILQELEGGDYWPIFVDGRWQLPVETRSLEMLLDRRVDGLILIGGQMPEETLRQIATKTPLLVVARQLPTMMDHCIYVDNVHGGYIATQYLLDLGHRNIVHIGAEPFYKDAVTDVTDRYEGYAQALRDVGLTPDPNLVIYGTLQRPSGVVAVETFLARERPFTAIFAANDQMAFGARLALYRRGFRVPDDISLVGFDNESPAAYMLPPLTTLHQPATEMGQLAVQKILKMIAGESASPTVFKPELIIRESATRSW